MAVHVSSCVFFLVMTGVLCVRGAEVCNVTSPSKELNKECTWGCCGEYPNDSKCCDWLAVFLSAIVWGSIFFLAIFTTCVCGCVLLCKKPTVVQGRVIHTPGTYLGPVANTPQGGVVGGVPGTFANPPSIYTGPGVAGPSDLLSYEQPPTYVSPAGQPPAYLPPLTSEKTPTQ